MPTDQLILAISIAQVAAGLTLAIVAVSRLAPQPYAAIAGIAAAVLLVGGLGGALAGLGAGDAGLSVVLAVIAAASILLSAALIVVVVTRRPREVPTRKADGATRADRDSMTELLGLFDTATRMSNTTIGFQDQHLRYRWMCNSNFGVADTDVATLDDARLIGDPQATILIRHKLRALESGRAISFELQHPPDDNGNWYQYEVKPIHRGGEAVGIVTTATDITRAKRLDKMRTDLSRRLADTLQRFDLAMKGGGIFVFSQDTDLRYTWANATAERLGVVVGKSDPELFAQKSAESIIELKREVLDSGKSAMGELSLGEGDDQRWYDLHIEPNVTAEGTVTGLTCAAIDVTHRIRNEQQMRIVMRELTHRTKNLLAVAIAIARQTAAQATSVDAFVQALNARLRALAVAQDLIVADDWAGVDMESLIKQQIKQLTPGTDNVRMAGPSVVLSPEATQNLGLVLHELAANATRYGALSSEDGRVSITWDLDENAEGPLLRLDWMEQGGPAVSPPSTRGFGLNVIERNLARLLKAEVDMRFEKPGFALSMALPLRHIAPSERLPVLSTELRQAVNS